MSESLTTDNIRRTIPVDNQSAAGRLTGMEVIFYILGAAFFLFVMALGVTDTESTGND